MSTARPIREFSFIIFFLILVSISVPSFGQEKTIAIFTGNNGFEPIGALVTDDSGNLYGATGAGGSFGCSDSGCGVIFQLVPRVAGGWREKVLHVFRNNGVDGSFPNSSLVLDASGNLYGTTTVGGTGTHCNYGGQELGCGTVFELSPTASGPWNETILYNFQNNGQDGFFPSSGVIFDPSGNLYGENSDGGGTGNFGTVFELSPVNNSWKETALHSFSGGNADGSSPTGGLALDTAGNLYGTTTSGGAYQSYGTVFELSPSSEGNWSETILHSFNDNGRDGYEPEHGVALDAAGNVYGTTFTGGRGVGGIGLGTIFELTPGADGTWRETIVHNFGSSPNDGYFPGAGLLLDGQGNIFGTTTFGGDCNSRFNGDCGTAYEVQPKTGGGWIETVLYTFPFDSDVHSDLIFGRSGNLYGTTELGGGSHNCEVFGHYGCGSAFEVKP